MNLLPAGECGDTGPKGDKDPQNPPMSPNTMALFTAYYAAANQNQVSVAPVLLSVPPLGSEFTRAVALDVSPAPPLPTCTRCAFAPSHSAAPVILYLDPAQPLFDVFLVVDGIPYGSGPSSGPILQAASAKVSVQLTGFPTSVGANSRAFLVWQDGNNNADYAQLQIIH